MSVPFGDDEHIDREVHTDVLGPLVADLEDVVEHRQRVHVDALAFDGVVALGEVEGHRARR
ncbi:MAG: hypothetical protein U5K28_04440 [Halobacteriales archaeon]|nr:hypothetical protein [Halobacteriales archaeon]